MIKTTHLTRTDKLPHTHFPPALAETVQALYGDLGTGSFGSSSSIKYFDPASRLYVVRTPREAVKEIQFAFTWYYAYISLGEASVVNLYVT